LLTEIWEAVYTSVTRKR